MAARRPAASHLLALVPKKCGLPSCKRLIASEDTHPYCIVCLGLGHALSSMSPPAPAAGLNCADCLRYNVDALKARYEIAAAGHGLSTTVSAGTLAGNPPRAPDSAVRHSAASRHVVGPPAAAASASVGSPDASEPHTASLPALSPTGSTGAVPKKKPCKTANVPSTPAATFPVTFREFHPLTVGDIPLSFSVPQLRAMKPPSPLSWHDSDGDEPEDFDMPGELDTEGEYSEEDESTLPSGQGGGAAGQVTHAEASTPAASSPVPTASLPPSTPGGTRGAAAQDADPIPMDELSILERATIRCGLEPPLGDAPLGPRARVPLLGQDVEPSPPPRMAKLPMVPGFAEALHSTWESRKDPPKLPFLVDCLDAGKAGIPLCPPMDKLMAQSLIGSVKAIHAKTGPGGRPPIALSVGKKLPGFTISLDDKQSSRVRNSYRSSALAARTMNATQLLLSSARRLFSEMRGEPSEAAEEMDKTLCMLMELNVHAIEWLGHGMDYCIQAERARWLDKVTLPGATEGETEKVLQDLPGHPTSLMGGGLDLLRQEVADKKITKELLEATTDPQNVPKEKRQGRSKAHAHAERGRSASKRSKSGNPRPPSAAPATPSRAAPATPTHSQTRQPPRHGIPASSHKARGKPPRK